MAHGIAPAPTTVADHSTGNNITDAEFERRWNAWQARGRVHDRATRRRLGIAAVVAAVAALGAVIVHMLLGS